MVSSSRVLDLQADVKVVVTWLMVMNKKPLGHPPCVAAKNTLAAQKVRIVAISSLDGRMLKCPN